MSGGYPKVIELYAEDRHMGSTKYGIDVASNGKASNKPDYYLQSGSLAGGKHYIIGRKSGGIGRMMTGLERRQICILMVIL